MLLYVFSIFQKLVVIQVSTFVVKILFVILDVKFEKGLRISGPLIIKKHPKGRIHFGRNIRINSGYRQNPFGGENRVLFAVGKNGYLKIKSNVAMSNVQIHCYNEITIEENVMIGGGVIIFDTDFHSLSSSLKETKTRPILIKKNAFIGGYSMILKGVTVGNNSIIAAGSVVTKDVPPHQLWGGNPAKYIKQLD